MAWLLSAETVPAVVDVVKTKITHHHEIVRKKCVMVIHRCIQRMPEIASEVDEVLRRALCDKDASVMAASLHSFSLIIRLKEENPSLQMPDLKNLVPSFVSILKQVRLAFCVTNHELNVDSSVDY
jgi:vesicle coat complex subunit